MYIGRVSPPELGPFGPRPVRRSASLRTQLRTHSPPDRSRPERRRTVAQGAEHRLAHPAVGPHAALLGEAGVLRDA